MLILFFLLLVIIGVVIALVRTRNKVRHNRYTGTRHREPFLGSEPRSIDSEDVPPEQVVEANESYENSPNEPYIASPQDQAVLAIDDVEDDKESSAASAKTIDLIVMSVIADEGRPYTGYELLQALLSAGLRFGKMGIFHRHEEVNGRGEILFSLASAVEPGTFELPKMGGFSTLGLTLFMQLSALKDPMKAFEIMLNTARELVSDLGGSIFDDQRQMLTEEKITSWRSQITNS